MPSSMSYAYISPGSIRRMAGLLNDTTSLNLAARFYTNQSVRTLVCAKNVPIMKITCTAFSAINPISTAQRNSEELEFGST